MISPGGVGYDINCGVRLMRTNLKREDVQPRLNQLMDALFRQIPAGVGTGGPYLFGGKELRRLLAEGAPTWSPAAGPRPATSNTPRPAAACAGAEPDCVSQRAMKRGGDQCGTLGSGNHFLEVQVVDEVVDETAARTMGLEKDGVCVMIHSGSRGLGYQVCDDALAALRKAPAKYGIELPDRQLACAPVRQPRGAAVSGRDAVRGELRLGQPAVVDVADARGVRRVLRPHVGIDADEPGLRRGPQYRQDGAARDRRPAAAGVRASQGGDAGLPGRASRSARALSPDRPAGDHSRRHGPGQLGAGGPAGQHGADLRHHLPRRRPA